MKKVNTLWLPLFTACFLCGHSSVSAQDYVTIVGNTNVTQGSNEYYYTSWSPYQPSSYQYWYWYIPGNNSSVSENAFSATIYWNQVGTHYLEYELSTWDNYYWDNIAVTVTGVGPPTPSTTFTKTMNCGNTIVTRNSSPSANVEWYWQTSSSGTSTALGSAASITRTTTETLYLRARQSASPFTWSIGSANAGTTTIKPAVTTAPFAQNGSRCGTGSVTLSGTPQSGGANSLKWYTAGSGGTAFYTGTSYSATFSSTTTYYISSYHTTNACESPGRTPVTATITPLPVTGTITSNNASNFHKVCVGGSLQISVSGNTGTPLFWISSNNGASWDYESASNLGNPFNYSFPTLGTWLIQTQSEVSGCGLSSSTSIQIDVQSSPTSPINPIPGTRCGPGSVTIGASPNHPSNVVRWYTSSGGGTLLHTGNTFPTPSISVTTTYYAASYSTTTLCESSRIAVVATVNPLPTSPAANNSMRCGPGSITVSGTPATNANTLKWYAASSGGTAFHTGTSYNTSLSSTTTYYVSSFNSTTTCESATRTPVTATINPALAAGSLTSNNASNFHKVCVGGSLQISVSGNVGTPLYWISSNNGASWNYEDASNLGNPFNYAFPTQGTWLIRTQSEMSGCGLSADYSSIQVDVQSVPTSPINLLPSERCGAGTLVLGATPNHPSNVVKWYTGVSGGSALYAGNSYTTPSLSVTTTYYAASHSPTALCESSRVPVVATIKTIPSNPIGTPASRCGPGTVILGGTIGANGNQLRWYQTTTSTPALATGTSFTTPTLSSTTSYYITSFNTTTNCESARVQVIATIVPVSVSAPPQPTISTNLCGVKTLSRGTPPSGVGWYWQGIDPNGLDYTSVTATSGIFTASSTNTYYIRARDNYTGCWGPSNSVLVGVDNPPAPQPNSFTYCEWEPFILTTSGYLSNLKWYNTSNVLLHTGTSYPAGNLAPGSYSYNVKNVSAGGCESVNPAVVSLTVQANCDAYLNWTESTTFGRTSTGSSAVIGAARTYISGFGDPIQSQAKILTSSLVIAAQEIPDQNNNPVISTLPAPINSSSFIYRHRFATNSSNEKYHAGNFDGPTKLNNPDPIADGGPGTLGWYYSSSNTLEPRTPTTSYPYSRSYVAPGPNPTTSVMAGPGDQHRMGSTHEVRNERQKIGAGELDHYFKLAGYFIPSPFLWSPNLLSALSTSSTTGFTARNNVTIATVGGYIRATCNQTGGTPGIWPMGGNIAVIPGASYTLWVKGYRTGASGVELWVSNTAGTTIKSGPAMPSGIANEKWVSSTFTVPAGTTAIRVGVVWTNPTATGEQFFIGGVNLQTTVPTGTMGYKHIVTDPNGKQGVLFSDITGRELASASWTGGTYDNWNYAFYNDIGQLLATVAPKGVDLGSSLVPNFATTYKYDHLGRLIETTSPDEGTTQFVYSFDGKLRFSQNQEQRNASTKRFSYTNYDKFGRLIEAGEYSMSGTGYYVFETHNIIPPSTNSVLHIADNVGFTGITRKSDPNGRCSDYAYLDYDVQAADLPTGDALHATQTNMLGKISRTENANAKTWYSYNENGDLIWSKQYINALTAYKTIDYTYDFSDNITEVTYQKGITTEDFSHFYVYDADQRLIELKTSTDGGTTKLSRAKYYYYLHGPLKRVELMNGTAKVQGLDYVYTIHGALKSINHADNARDPGNDTDDIFGETLVYYEHDYSGEGYPAGEIAFSSYTNQFGGAIKGLAWHSPADNHMNTNAYAFNYDPLYQLNNANFGTLTGTSSYAFTGLGNMHKEAITTYDKNGNINALQRYGKTANVLANYDYVYIPNTNMLDKINHNGSLLIDYTYSSIGQMIQQVEGSNTLKVTYDARGLVKAITNGSNVLLEEFLYDDQGNRFIKKKYNSGTLESTYYYVHDALGNVLAIYENTNSQTQLTEVPVYAAGRIGSYRPVENSYLYEVNDHLGNVRGVIGLPETQNYRATMETENVLLEEPPDGFFNNVSARRATFIGANVTTNYTNTLGVPVTGNEVVRVNNTAPAGPGISLKVSPGDKLSAGVWAYYEAGSNYNAMISSSGMITAIAAAFGGISGAPGEAGKIYSAINSGLTTLLGGGTETTRPAAYLQYIVYDANLNPTGQKGYFRVSTSSNMSKSQVTMPEITIEQPGFIYIFVYNRSDSPNWVYFDELTVVHNHSPVVAGADYYPFGLAMDGRKVTDEEYRWGYQGQFSEEEDKKTGWNEFELRFYDAKIARWLTTDPYGQYYSPYMAMENTPNMGVDPSGGFAISGFIRYGTAFAVGAVTGGATTGTWEGALLGGVGGVGLYAGLSNISAIGKAIGNVIGTNWQPLTKAILREYVKTEWCQTCSDGQLEYEIGDAFEEHWHKWAQDELKFNRYRRNDDKFTDNGTRPTVPDGLADHQVFRWINGWPRVQIIRNASWFEVKAKNGKIYNSTSANQIDGHITNLATSNPIAVRNRVARLHLVTTSEVEISRSVSTNAFNHGVSVHQHKAMYKMTDTGQMRVRWRRW